MEFTYKPTDYEIKLIILYAVKTLKIDANYTILDYVISSSANVNYFELEQYIKNLIDIGNLTERTSGADTVFSITESGEETLGFFSNKIPGSIMERLNDIIFKVNREALSGNKISVDYYPLNENEYTVKISIEEDKKVLMNMEFYAGPKERAREISRYLKANTEDFYKKVASLINEGSM